MRKSSRAFGCSRLMLRYCCLSGVCEATGATSGEVMGLFYSTVRCRRNTRRAPRRCCTKRQLKANLQADGADAGPVLNADKRSVRRRRLTGATPPPSPAALVWAAGRALWDMASGSSLFSSCVIRSPNRNVTEIVPRRACSEMVALARALSLAEITLHHVALSYAKGRRVGRVNAESVLAADPVLLPHQHYLHFPTRLVQHSTGQHQERKVVPWWAGRVRLASSRGMNLALPMGNSSR